MATTLSMILILAWASVWKVPTGHRGVVIFFGRVRPETFGPGLHLALPAPIVEVRMIPVNQVLSIQVKPDAAGVFKSQTGEFLTGDENLVFSEIRVEYRISDLLESARSGLDRIESKLQVLAKSQLVETLALTPISSALGMARENVAELITKRLQQESDRIGLGVQIIKTSWVRLVPPEEVRSDFEEAQTAANQAARQLAGTRSEVTRLQQETVALVSQIQNRALTDAAESIAVAKAESVKFQALQRQAQRTGLMLTAKELWLQTLDKILPQLKARTVLATDQPVDLTIIRSQNEPTKAEPIPPDPQYQNGRNVR
jgi:membrane protease subunit HflK